MTWNLRREIITNKVTGKVTYGWYLSSLDDDCACVGTFDDDPINGTGDFPYTQEFIPGPIGSLIEAIDQAKRWMAEFEPRLKFRLNIGINRHIAFANRHGC